MSEEPRPDSAAEIAALRRRVALLEARLDRVEIVGTAPATRRGFLRARGGLPPLIPSAGAAGASTARAVHGPGGETDAGPRFERGLDVPAVSNWSPTLFLLAAGLVLLLFLVPWALGGFRRAAPRHPAPAARTAAPTAAARPAPPAPPAAAEGSESTIFVELPGHTPQPPQPAQPKKSP